MKFTQIMKDRIRLMLNKTAAEKGLMSGGGEGRFIDANSGFMCADPSSHPSFRFVLVIFFVSFRFVSCRFSSVRFVSFR